MTLDKNEVILSLPDGEGSENQLWTLGTMFKNGYFTLRNPQSGGYLTATSETSTTTDGDITTYLTKHFLIFLVQNIEAAAFNYYHVTSTTFLIKFCSV